MKPQQFEQKTSSVGFDTGVTAHESESAFKWSLEIVPRHAGNLGKIPEWVREIYITMIPGDEIREVLEATRKVREVGRIPVPHIAARGLESEEQFGHLLDSLEELGVDRLLFIGGGVGDVQGPYDSVMDLFKTGLLKREAFREVGVAGHPEGNPSDPDAEKNLLEKIHWANERKLPMRIVTQWSFNAQVINAWILDLREKGVENPIHIGIPGPASLKSLLRYAKVCGVQASTEVLKKQGFNLGKLVFVNKPDRMVSEIEGHQQLHLFPFGGLEKTSEWLEQHRSHASTA